MPRLYTSYSHECEAEVNEMACLVEELRARGLKTWQDVSDIYSGEKFESQIREGMEASDGLLAYLSPAALASPYVTKLELPLGLELNRKRDLFAVIPVFRGFSSFKAAAFATKEALGRDLTLFQGYLIPEEGTGEKLGEVALASLLHFYPRDGGVSCGEPLLLGLHTRAYTPGNRELELDWTPLLSAGSASSEEWTRLWRATNDVKRVLEENSKRRDLLIEGHFHLSAGFLLGYVFRATSGYRLSIAQDGEEWTQGYASDVPFSMATDYGPIGSDYITLEICAVQDICPAVNALLASRDLEPRARLQVTPEGRPRANSVARRNAWALARLAAEETKRLRAELEADRIELYMAGPKALAVLLGAEFNAHGASELCTFEFGPGGYQPALVIKEEQ